MSASNSLKKILKNESLIVAETFYSIQGEGRYSGTPSVFLRLAGCNLLCKGAGWICDSIEVWKHGKATPFADVLHPAFITALCEGAHLVITGGEPLLHQAALVDFINYLSFEVGINLFIEVETNGTIEPSPSLAALVNHWNVSPKLSTSGVAYAQRINEAALMNFNRRKNSDFKIVISCNDDVIEIINDLANYINMHKVILMPAGATQSELEQSRLLVIDACKRLFVRYCDRLHIVAWNLKTGV